MSSYSQSPIKEDISSQCVCVFHTDLKRKSGGTAVISSGALTAYQWTVLLAPLFWLVRLLDIEPNGALSCLVNHKGIPQPHQQPIALRRPNCDLTSMAPQ